MAKIINVIPGINQEQSILGLNPGTLVMYTGQVCVRSWAGLSSLDGKLHWSNETLGLLPAKGVVLPTGTVVEVNPRMRLTNKDLQREYRRINKAYFDDKLPRNMKVRFDGGELEAEIYGEYFDSEKEILSQCSIFRRFQITLLLS